MNFFPRFGKLICIFAVIAAPVLAYGAAKAGLVNFTRRNANDDAAFNAGTDTLLRAEPWMDDGSITTVAAGLPNYVTFTPAGITRAIGGGVITGSLVMCDDRGDAGARILLLTPTGRPAVRKHSAVSGAPGCP